ncbi:hypothetical protein PTSG_10886 [Salpingoeca rosetta]|uniref:Ion transport domain-containing protein n=1 Tax=Salpingoeca rosetta (strain ATCC 50818 / BSB-021) TaxID=946362 RepID=F2URA4_SALR5|nr:uncharacterized protein PTSG_10886 [Salpingoeca rosetta]EGD80207.1 hypothetical protein PTSG_10886 [Salpingoeca rosetta]|eukprot:XP_004988269.1 hypothetical protein PTSG_10886 [Salpingoeca rosetta]
MAFKELPKRGECAACPDNKSKAPVQLPRAHAASAARFDRNVHVELDQDSGSRERVDRIVVPAHAEFVYCYTFNPLKARSNGTRYHPNLRRVWLGTGKVEHLSADLEECIDLAFSPDTNCRRLLQVFDTAVAVWNPLAEQGIASQRPVLLQAVLPANARVDKELGDAFHLTQAVMTPSMDRVIAFGNTDFVFAWARDYINAIATTCDGRILALGIKDLSKPVGEGHLVRLHDLASMTELADLQGHTDVITALREVRTSSPGRAQWVCTASKDGTLKLWDTDRQECEATLAAVNPPFVQGYENTDIASGATVLPSPDGRFLVSRHPNATYLWDLARFECVKQLACHGACAWLPGSKHLIGMSGQTLLTFAAQGVQEAERPRVVWNGSDCGALCLTHDEQRAVVRQLCCVLVFDVHTSALLARTELPGNLESVFAVTRDDSHVAVSNKHSIHVLRLDNDLSEDAVLQGHTRDVEHLTITYDGRYLASGTRRGEMRLWDISNRAAPTCIAIVAPLQSPDSPSFVAMAALPGAPRVAACTGDGSLRVWAIGEEAQRFRQALGQQATAAQPGCQQSPSQQEAHCSSSEVPVTCVATFATELKVATCMAVKASDELVAVGGEKGTVKIYTLAQVLCQTNHSSTDTPCTTLRIDTPSALDCITFFPKAECLAALVRWEGAYMQRLTSHPQQHQPTVVIARGLPDLLVVDSNNRVLLEQWLSDIRALVVVPVGPAIDHRRVPCHDPCVGSALRDRDLREAMLRGAPAEWLQTLVPVNSATTQELRNSSSSSSSSSNHNNNNNNNNNNNSSSSSSSSNHNHSNSSNLTSTSTSTSNSNNHNDNDSSDYLPLVAWLASLSDGAADLQAAFEAVQPGSLDLLTQPSMLRTAITCSKDSRMVSHVTSIISRAVHADACKRRHHAHHWFLDVRGLNTSFTEDLIALIAGFPDQAAELLDSLGLVPLHTDHHYDHQQTRLPESQMIVVGHERGYGEFFLWKRLREGKVLHKLEDAGATPTLTEACIVPIPYAAAFLPGKEETSFLRALADKGKAELFGSRIVRAVVQFKWETFGQRRFLWEAAWYMLSLVLITVLTFVFNASGKDLVQLLGAADNSSANASDISSVVIVALLAGMAFHDLVQEVRQVVAINNYLFYVWNWMDLASISLIFVVVGTYFAGWVHARAFLALAVYLRWYRLLYYLQPFQSTGPLVRMILVICYDMRYFLLVLGISIVAAWTSFRLLLRDDSALPVEELGDPANGLLLMFNMLLLADFDLATFDGDYVVLLRILFVISMVLVPVVLLNLLIALMSDSYERIQDRADIEFQLLRARILHEQEKFMTKKEKRNPKLFPKWLHVLVPKGGAGSGGVQWQGVLHALKKEVAGVDNRVSGVERKVEEQMADVQAKMEEALTLLKKLSEPQVPQQE